jgi:hypothetical protein
MKAATVYKRGNRIYIHASSKTTAGVWIATPPFIQVEADVSASDLGKFVVDALCASQLDVPHPTKWSGVLAPLLEQAGVKSWATFMRKAQCLNLEADEQRLKVIPNRNLGMTEGFEPMLDKRIEAQLTSSLDQLGTVLTEALALCQ